MAPCFPFGGWRMSDVVFFDSEKLPSLFLLALSLSSLSPRRAKRARSLRSLRKKKRASTLATRTTHRPERLWRVTPLKTDVRDAGPREFFFSSAAPCVPPDDVAAEDISTISARRAQKVGRVAVWGARRGRPLCLLKMETSSVGAERGFRKKKRGRRGCFPAPLSGPKRALASVYGPRKLRCERASEHERGVARGKRAQGVERGPDVSDVAGAAERRRRGRSDKRSRSFFFLCLRAVRCPCTPRAQSGEDGGESDKRGRRGCCLISKTRNDNDNDVLSLKTMMEREKK